jgi:agmatinase
MKNLTTNFIQYLCPPGNGVYTVHTAKANKESLHAKLYQTTNTLEVQSKWEDSLEFLEDWDKPVLLGMCLDTGGGIQRGANWGPLFIREHMINSIDTPKYFDLGDIRVIPQLLHDKYLNDETIKSCQEALYPNIENKDNLKVSALSIAEVVTRDLFTQNKKVLSLGGDHSVSYPLVKSWLEVKKEKNIRTAIIHFDAHTDLMPKRLGIDICFASWAFHMIELLEKPSDLMQFGIRSSGQPKEHWERVLGVQQFWPDDFKTTNIAKETIKYLKEQKIEEVYISFDIDALDAKYASATGTPESEGLEPHTCIMLIEEIAKVCKVTGGDVVEVAPFVQSNLKNKMTPEPDTTIESASLIARKILEVMS